jgi:hypothetical protein
VVLLDGAGGLAARALRREAREVAVAGVLRRLAALRRSGADAGKSDEREGGDKGEGKGA